MKLKKSAILSLIIMVTVVMSLSVVAAAKTTIRIGSSFEQGHILVQAANKFKEIVESSTDNMEVQVFPGGSMGSEEELTEQVSINAVEMQAGGGLPIKTYAPDYYFFDTPYVMKDFDHFMRVWNSELGEEARKLLAEKGNTEYLGIIYRGIRHTTSNRPIKDISDLKGLKLRLPQLPSWVTIWKKLGVKPVPVALPELFTSLQTGVADASEGPAQQISAFKLYEVQDYLIKTGHMVQTGALTISKSFLDNLEPAQRKLVIEAGDQACKWATEKSISEEQELIDELKDKGMEVIELDTKEFRDKVRPAVEGLFEEKWPVTTWEEVLSY